MARNDNFIARDELLYHLCEIMPPIGENEVADEMYQIVLEAGSIDVDYVRHGRWEEPGMDGVYSWSNAYRKCSVCSKRVYLGITMNYCPNCGAKMDKEEEHND